MLIKLILLAGIALFGILAMQGAPTAGRRAFWRLTGLAVLALGAVSVVFPNTLTWLAKLVGVGRGADLLVYALAVSFLIVVAILFRRIAELEERCVTLARCVAILEVQRDESDSVGDGEPEK